MCTILKKNVPSKVCPGFTSDKLAVKEAYKASGWCIEKSAIKVSLNAKLFKSAIEVAIS